MHNIDSPYYNFCADIGHLALTEDEPEYFIEAIAEKVKQELKVEQLTPELVAEWLSNHGMSLDPSLDIKGKDPLRVLSIGTRPVLTDVIEDFSALVLDKYIQEEEVLDQEVLHYLKQRIIFFSLRRHQAHKGNRGMSIRMTQNLVYS